MGKYQIVEVKGKEQHAGSKAREDVARFAEEYGAKPLYIKCRERDSDSFIERILRFALPVFGWIKAYFSVEKNSMVILQNPFLRRQMGREQCIRALKAKKNCTIVSVIHDIGYLRGSNWIDPHRDSEFAFMKETTDYEIIHNDFMKKELEGKGFSAEQLVSLEIFDYYSEKEVTTKRTLTDKSADCAIAGNFDPKKSSYVYKIPELNSKFTLNLYGLNYQGESTEFINYKGSFPADEIPCILEGNFGIVWDGEEIDTCSGETGNYLRYNNPHKTSLYLVARLPVIIWSEAAMAEFVRREGVGICVNSFEEIKAAVDALTPEAYAKMVENTDRIAKRLETGYYLKNALKECEKRITENNR